MHKAIEPLGESMNDYDIFRALAGRLGYEQAFTEGRDEMGWCQWIYDQLRDKAVGKSIELPDFQQFWAEGSVELPSPDRDFVLFEEFRHDPERHPLKTPSGRIELVSETIAGFGYDDCLGHAAWIAPAEWLGSPRAEQWPIHLVTHQPQGRLHSQMDPGPVSQSGKIAGREAIQMNPTDAAPRDIRDGDLVQVYNDRGACLASAVLDEGVMPQVAIMATGAWFDPSNDADAPERHGNPNVLTLDIGTSKLSQGPSALSVLVDIERWSGSPPDVQVFMKPLATAG